MRNAARGNLQQQKVDIELEKFLQEMRGQERGSVRMVAMDSLAGVFTALAEWASGADLLSPSELAALIAHKRAFGQPWANPERPL